VKRVAIKVIRERFPPAIRSHRELVGEAKLVADLIHTNIVQTYHLGEARGVCFICHGADPRGEPRAVNQRLTQSGPQAARGTRGFIVSRIARGLAYAHTRTIPTAPLFLVHRDISRRTS